ncbi:MAG TPA: 4Fe-4S cluster-binding domain-containing protein, partial [Candidatus Brocadiales bacterium]|nr:4Fe-4S cluster-binding domain-containing protein [Candidatus Brocadiales bacterium]
MKPSSYNFVFKENGDIYIYNAFVNSFAKINSEIAAFINSPIDGDKAVQVSKEAILPLIRGGFVVEDGKDELAELKVRNRLGRFGRTSFGITVAPTLACNFKCTYCFEQPSSEKMSQKTADTVYDFVLKNLKDKTSFGVCWYGGEPLLALDIIEYLS